MSEARPRRLWRHGLALLAAWALVELAAYAIYWGRYGEPMSLTDLGDVRGRIASGEEISGALPRAGAEDTHEKWAAHPYVGYVVDPLIETWLTDDATHVMSTSDVAPEIPPRPRDGRVIVGLFGGSVAFQLGNDHPDPLLTALAALHPGDEIVLVVAAQPSWKQPQMLMSLQWLTLRGYRFDRVIELDGFNEVAGAYANHRWHGTNAAYPYNYRALMASSHEGPEFVMRAGELRVVERGRQARAAWLDGTPLGWLPSVSLVWWTLDQGDQARVAALRDELRAHVSEDALRYAQRGPVDDLGDVEADDGPLYDRVADIWVEANRQMARLAEREGATFTLALQPNQYLDGSKPEMTDAERAECLVQDAFVDRINAGYPRLLARGRGLSEEEHVRFLDLTQVFRETPDRTYADWCCHYTERGYRMVAEALVGGMGSGEEGGSASGTDDLAAPGTDDLAAPGTDDGLGRGDGDGLERGLERGHGHGHGHGHGVD